MILVDQNEYFNTKRLYLVDSGLLEDVNPIDTVQVHAVLHNEQFTMCTNLPLINLDQLEGFHIGLPLGDRMPTMANINVCIDKCVHVM